MANAYGICSVSVVRAEQISPNFIRVTFTAPELKHCGDTLLDQRVKLIFTDRPESLLNQAGDWYTAWRSLPNDERPPMRTYTLREVRQEAAEIDIDFACHGENGPASSFAINAEPGQTLVFVGPDARVPESARSGIAWQPGDAREVLLVGDETAVPAVVNIVSTLPADATGLVVLDVPDAADEQPVSGPAGVEIRWFARNGSALGELSTPHVVDWAKKRSNGVGSGEADDVVDYDPETGAMIWEEADGAAAHAGRYAWLAGEASWVTGMRRTLVKDLGMPRTQLAFMGYWKAGVAALG